MVLDLPQRLDSWITRCERYEDNAVRAETGAFLQTEEARRLPQNVFVAMERAAGTTDRILTALSLLAALDSLTLPRQGEGRAD